MSTGEVASSDSHAHPLDASRFHLQQLDSSRSRTPMSTELDTSYMGYVCYVILNSKIFVVWLKCFILSWNICYNLNKCIL